jgi:hypothetical protein
MAEKEEASGTPTDVENGSKTEEEKQQTTSIDVPYTIYSKKQKIAIILAASVASFFSPMSANIYIPALNSIAADLHVSNTLINLTLTSYLVRIGPFLFQHSIYVFLMLNVVRSSKD